MSIPITSVGSQAYFSVQIATAATQYPSPPKGVEDVHICGACRLQFSDIELFMNHKRGSCPGSKCVTTSSVQGSSVQPGLVTSGGVTFGQPFFLVTDGQNQHQGSLQAMQEDNGNPETQILRSRLLGLNQQHENLTTSQVLLAPQQQQQQQAFVTNHNQHVQSVMMQKREFENDEEDVATLLANQLASEVVNSAAISRTDQRVPVMSTTTDPVPQSLISVVNFASEVRTSEADGTLELGSAMGGADIMGAPEHSLLTVEEDVGGGERDSGGGTKYRKSKSRPYVRLSNAEIKPEVKPDIDKQPRPRKKHNCSIPDCTFSTYYAKDLVRHMRKHTGERPFHCETCNRWFSRGDKLQTHMRIHLGEKRHRCNLCEYAAVDSGSLRKHMRIHTNERPYKCQICPYRARDSSQLVVHLRTHTGDNPFLCSYASCSAAFKTSSDLKRHTRMHTGEKPYSCSMCDYKCAIKSNLKVHMKLNHTDAKTFSCLHCKFSASSRRVLKDHQKTHAEDLLKCNICDYTCVYRTALRSHLKVHSDEKPFSCKECSYSCKQLGNLKNHFKKKHPEKSLKKSKGKDGSLLKQNSRNLKGPSKPFCVKSHKCTFCDAAFVREDSWRSHMRQHQNQEAASNNSPSMFVMADMPCENNSEQTGRAEGVLPGDNQECTAASDNILPNSFVITIDGVRANEMSNETIRDPDKPKDGFEDEAMVINASENSYLVPQKIKKDGMQGENMQTNSQQQPVILYVQSAISSDSADDNLRNAEILASLNQATSGISTAGQLEVGQTLLVTRPGGQSSLMTFPTEQGTIVEHLAATLQPGLQYVLSGPVEGMITTIPAPVSENSAISPVTSSVQTISGSTSIEHLDCTLPMQTSLISVQMPNANNVKSDAC